MIPAVLLAAVLLDERALRLLLSGKPRLVELAAGTITVSSEIHLPAGFELRGHPRGTLLRASAKFTGRAILVCDRDVTVTRLVLDGNRTALERPIEIPAWNRTFLQSFDRNGIAASQAHNLTLRDLTIRNVANFAVLVSASDRVTLERVSVLDSGSHQVNGRNNTSGGILFEEGSADFAVRQCRFTRIRGNGVWTHSLYTSARNGPGSITSNTFDTLGRDAIQAGHATKLTIDNNTGRRIGWPLKEVDVEGGGTPVAIDTAGNVDQTSYLRNRFEEVNGKCIDLDGFHHGQVRENVCVNKGDADEYPFGNDGIVFNNTNPDMQSEHIEVSGNTLDGVKFSGIFVIGRNHVIHGNQLTRINLARCNDEAARYGCLYDPKQPDLLRSGIYLSAGGQRSDPARDNEITGNTISGSGMKDQCIGFAPGTDRASQKEVADNECTNLQ